MFGNLGLLFVSSHVLALLVGQGEIIRNDTRDPSYSFHFPHQLPAPPREDIVRVQAEGYTSCIKYYIIILFLELI